MAAETIDHLFFSRIKVQPLLEMLHEICRNNDIVTNEHWLAFIFNYSHENPKHIINFVTIFLKQYIYACRCQGRIPRVPKFVYRLEMYHLTEYYSAKTNGQIKKHEKRWDPIIKF